MKKLSLLLTSFLLVSGANAGLAEFTNDSIQLNGWQDFQVAHPCAFWRVHIGGEHNNGLKTKHTRRAQCAKKSWIETCRKKNMTVNTERGGYCKKRCPADKEPGPGALVDTCQHTEASCKRVGKKFNSVLHKCLGIAEWNTYCRGVNPNFVYGVAQENCVNVVDLRRYCREKFDKGYDAEIGDCRVCPVGTFPQDGGCLSVEHLTKYCRDTEKGSHYDPPTDDCVCSNELPFAQWGRQCVHVGSYCKKANGQVWDTNHNRCRSTCSVFNQKPDADNICR